MLVLVRWLVPAKVCLVPSFQPTCAPLSRFVVSQTGRSPSPASAIWNRIIPNSGTQLHTDAGKSLWRSDTFNHTDPAAQTEADMSYYDDDYDDGGGYDYDDDDDGGNYDYDDGGGGGDYDGGFEELAGGYDGGYAGGHNNGYSSDGFVESTGYADIGSYANNNFDEQDSASYRTPYTSYSQADYPRAGDIQADSSNVNHSTGYAQVDGSNDQDNSIYSPSDSSYGRASGDDAQVRHTSGWTDISFNCPSTGYDKGGGSNYKENSSNGPARNSFEQTSDNDDWASNSHSQRSTSYGQARGNPNYGGSRGFEYRGHGTNSQVSS